MAHRRLAVAWPIAFVLLAVACSSSGPSNPGADPITPAPSGAPAVPGRSGEASPASSAPIGGSITFDEYAALFCGAFAAMDRAVGNPDTGSGSARSRALDAAMAARDGAAARPLAAAITADLEAARGDAALAGAGWPSARPLMAHVDRLMRAFEAQVAVKLAIAEGRPDPGEPQAAFEAAGGLEAWSGLFDTYGQVVRPPGNTAPCPTISYIRP